MNKSFKIKYNIKTSQVKAVPEIAKNCQSSTTTRGGGASLFRTFSLALLMSGILTSVAYANPTWLSTDFETGESGVNHGWNEKKAWSKKGKNNEILGNVILAPIKLNGNYSKDRFLGVNTDVTQSVIIGPKSAGRNKKQGMTILGYNAVGWESQATALGNNVYAGAQGTAVGSDVMAAGYASIAIGNDDISSQGGYADTLPQELILKIYGYNENDGNKTTYKNILSKDEFLGKYGQKNGQDNRHYSPTYSAGIGAIAIGSRSVAYGDTSLALGTLSFALAKSSTALGVRAFVSEEANGGVAIGDESRVFAAKSFAIGNEAESTNTGAISYGTGAKAVGEGSIAIGTKVASNAKIDENSAQQFRQKLMNELGIGTIIESEDNSGANKIVKTEVEDLKTGNENRIVQAGFANNLTDNMISKNIRKVVKDLNLTYTEEKKEFLSITTNGVKKSIKKKQKDGDHAITIGYYTANSGDNTVAIGTASYVKGKNSVVLGALNNVGKYASNTVAIGVGTNVHKENSIALGTGTTITGAGAIGIGSGVGITKDNSIGIGYGAYVSSTSSMAIGNDAKINQDANNSVALGNKTEVDMINSVALGYNSNTKYYYKIDGDKNISSVSDGDKMNKAINLKAYVPKGTSYNFNSDVNDGIVSVGGWDKGSGNPGLRRIINVAPGALDSDAATVGQLKALEYKYKEGVVAYYTKQNDKIYKVVKGDNGKFYKADTSDGTPLDRNVIPNKDVFVGPKGANENTRLENGKNIIDMGDKIKFAHILDGEISQNSDEAITGGQIYQLGETILGIDVNNTKFNTHKFTAVEYNGASKTNPPTTFKKAIDETIIAINKGLKISDSNTSGLLQLGDTLKIIAGDIDNTNFKSKNIKTSYSKDNKELLIGIEDEPTFKKVELEEKQEYKNNEKVGEKELITKGYLKGALENLTFNNGSSSFKVSGNSGNSFTIDQNNNELKIKGNNNIKTEANTTSKELKISLSDNLKGISSIGKDDNVTISFDNTQSIQNIEFAVGDNTKYKFSTKGLDLGSKKIANLADGNITNSSKEAITGKQLLDLATKLGINVKDNKTEFKELTFDILTLKEVNGSNEKAPTSIINSLEKVVSKLNLGLSYKADVKDDNAMMFDYKTQYLGSKLDIVKATSDVKIKTNETEETYVGNNLITKYTNTNGNGKFEIGLKEKPDFKEISIKDNNKTYAVLGGNNTNGGSLIFKDKDGTNESISIKAGEKPTIAFKTNNEANQTKGIGVITGLADLGDGADNTSAVNKKYVDDKLESKSAKLQVAGNTGESFEVFDGNNKPLTIKGKELTVKYSLDETKNKSQKETKHQNITATTQPDTKTLELSLNEHLKDMKSITGGEIGAGNGKKIASSIEFNKKGVNGTKAKTNVVIKSNGADFVFDRTGLTLSSKQIKGITSGLGINSISEAGQETNLQTIANVLSGNPDGNNSNNKIAQNAVNVQDLSTIAKAIIDKGLTFKGTELTKPQGGQQTQQQATFSLGSIIEIDSSESKNGKSKDPSGSELDKKDKDIKVSIASNNNTNKITLSLNKSETLSLDDERVITSKAVKEAIDDVQKTIIAKTDASNPFKTTYKDKDGKELEKHGDKFYKKEDIPDGVKYDKNKQKFVKKGGNETDKQPTALNEDEAKKVQEIINLKGNPKKIANVDSGLGLEKYKELNPQGSDEEAKNKYKQSKKDAIDKLLGNNANEDNNIKDSDPMLNNVATIRDLQALGQAGMDFMGNNETEKVHRNLGQKLVIKGDQNTTQSKFESAKDNINVAVESEALVVQLSKNLKNLTSAEFKAEDITSPKTKTTINSTGTTIVELGDNEKENGKKAEYTLNGTKVTDNTNTFETNAKGISLKQKTNHSNEKEVFAITNNSGKVTIEFKQKEGENFTGKITGLADITEDSTGDTAVNKKYVDTKFGELDSKLTSTNSNRPFDYYLDDDKVIKGEDGKFYKPGELKGATYDNASKTYKKQDKDLNSTIANRQNDVVIKAEPKGKALVVTNIADGKLSTDSKDAINGGQLIKATGAKLIDNPDSSATEPKIMAFADGKDGLSGLEKISDGKKAMATEGLTSKDNLNGKNANDKANALRDGEAGTVVFTDNQGNRLVKANNGKYYKKEDIEDDGVTPTDNNKAVEKPQLSLSNYEGNTTKPIVLSNVASGLGISEILESEKQSLTEAVNEKKEALKKQDEAVQTAKDQVGKKQQALMTAKNELSKMATERPPLLMKKAEIEQQIKTLDENDPQKVTMQSALDDIEKELKQNDQKMTEATKVVSEASDALDKAKITLADNVLKAHEAQQALTTAEETLRNKENGVDKIQALFSDKSDIAEANVVTVKDLKAVAKAGLNFEGNDAKRVHKNLSETLAIKGEENISGDKFNSHSTAAGNIKVEMSKDGKGLDIKLSDKLKNMASFETKEINGTKSVLNSNGLQATSKDSETIVTAKGTEIKSKDGKSAKYNIDGIELKGKNGEPSLMATNSGLIISGNNGNIILDGTKGQILIPDIDNPKNYAQVVNKNYVDSRVGAVVNHLDNVNKNLQAGIAGANAAATLPMSSIPGRSVMAISAGTYKGKSAVALGFSSVSDNGKVLFKIQGNSNSVGDFAGGIGVGWTW